MSSVQSPHRRLRGRSWRCREPLRISWADQVVFFLDEIQRAVDYTDGEEML